MRLCAAVDLNDDARAAIAAEQRRLVAALRGSGTLTPTRVDQLHLTLVFLADVPDGRGAEVVEALSRPFDPPAFDVEFGGLGAFPPHGAPRVVWIGLRRGAREAIDLQSAVAARLDELGLTIEARAFHPHLTLARWRDAKPSDRARVLRQDSGQPVAAVHVASVSLYRSALGRGGATHTLIASGRLR
jgi:2'-5' RNA ligase